MAILFSDAYPGGDTSALGANYTEAQGDSSIVTNRIRVASSNASVPGLLLTTTSAHADTADVKVTATAVSATGDGGPVARCTDSDTAPTLYMLDSYPNVVELYRHNNSAGGTLLDTGIAATKAANDIVALEVSGTGATVTLKSYRNGALLDTVLDTSGSRITAAGRTGLLNWVNGGTTTRDYDDFKVEDLVAAGGQVPYQPKYQMAPVLAQ